MELTTRDDEVLADPESENYAKGTNEQIEEQYKRIHSDLGYLLDMLEHLNSYGVLYKDLTISRATVATVSISWTTLFIEGIKSEGYSGTVDITASGAGGLDTGAEAVSTWYYIWAIQGESGVSCLLSASHTDPTMPTGYTKKKLISAVYNDGAGDFRVFYQEGNYINYGAYLMFLNAGTAGATTEVDSSAYFPENTRDLDVMYYQTAAVVVTTIYGYMNGGYRFQAYPYSSGGGLQEKVTIASVNRKVAYDTTGTLYLYACGFWFMI